MKSELIKKEFEPIEIKLTFETRKEYEAFFTLISYTSATQKAEIVNRQSNRDDNGLFPIRGLVPNDFTSMEKICDTIGCFEKY